MVRRGVYILCPPPPPRLIPKRATAVVVGGGGEEFVLVADKTGEVWQYSLAQPSLPGTHLLGHFSMLLDMVSECLTDMYGM